MIRALNGLVPEDYLGKIEVDWDASAPEGEMIPNPAKLGAWLCRDQETFLQLMTERGIAIVSLQ